MIKTLVIDQKDAHLYSERNRLMVRHESFVHPISVPFTQMDSLVIGCGVTMSSTLLTKLAKCDITVSVLPTRRTGQACRLIGNFRGNVSRRVHQYQLCQSEALRLAWATRLIRLKLRRQALLLVKLSGHISLSEDAMLQAVMDKLIHSYQGITPTSLDSLRGVEGSSAQLFFGAYRRFFDQKWRFVTRNRRPPKDPINVLLSLGYTLMTQLYEQSLYAIGLDPFLGILHDETYGRQSLACDFAEIGRADIEAWVWQLVQDEEFDLEMFDFDGEYACTMNKAGRAVFYRHWVKLKPKLQRQAHRHAHIFLKRLTKTQTKLMFIQDLTKSGV